MSLGISFILILFAAFCIWLLVVLLDVSSIISEINTVTIYDINPRAMREFKVDEGIFFPIYRLLRLSVLHFVCVFYNVVKRKSDPMEKTKRFWENRSQRTWSVLKLGIGLWIWVIVICIDVWSLISDNDDWALYHMLRFAIEHLIVLLSPGLFFVASLNASEKGNSDD